MASYSQQEKSYYDQLFSVIDKTDSGVLPGQDALPFLVSSNLPQQTLGEVWALADPENNGFLTKEAWYRAARLIGWMQKGGQTQVDESLVSKGKPNSRPLLIASWTIPLLCRSPDTSSAGAYLGADYGTASSPVRPSPAHSGGPGQVHQDLCGLRSAEWARLRR
jgi:epidermal growth factor receptor substrate 15